MTKYMEAGPAAGTRVLVTGGAGFIGSHLCRVLLDRGCRVRCLDDLSTGRRENLEPFAGHPDFEWTEGDIRDADACMEACRGMEYVCHQAAWGSVPRSVAHPVLYEQINVGGTLHMLEAARQNRIRRFVYASSSSVYGDEERLPKTEGREGLPLSPYALTKQADEAWAGLYTRLYGLETVGLRYFNVFGPRQDPGGPYAAVIPRFIGALLDGRPPVIHGDGLQSRDFTYVDNVVVANLLALTAGSGAAGRAFNIACGGRITLLELHRALCALIGRELEPVFDGGREGDIRHSFADISWAAEALGYAPRWSFERGLAETVRWYRTVRGGA